MLRTVLPLAAIVLTTAGGCAEFGRSLPVAAAPRTSANIVPAAVAMPVLLRTTVPVIPNLPSAQLIGAQGTSRRGFEVGDPKARVALANAAARVQPTHAGYANAEQIYSFDAGALFQVYAAPGRITDIALEAGEQLSSTGPVAAGDTTRWVIGDTVSGSGATRRVHILVKPTRPNLETNLVVTTDRRTYHLELQATPTTYMASVAWAYPEEERLAQAAAASRLATPAVAVEQLNFAYKISGDKPRWRPVRAFDDGRQTVIEFPPSIAQTEMPPLFVGGSGGKTMDIVNYRVNGDRIVVDRLFDTAELRLGDKRSAQRVRIERVRSR